MDFEPLSTTTRTVYTYPTNDLTAIMIDLTRRINIKVAIFVFLMGIFIFSDLFIDQVLSRFDSATEGLETTTKGTIIQLIFLTVGYIAFDLLVQGNVL